MRVLSKSKLIAFRQCPKRLWLEIHQPALRQDSNATRASFDVGYQVGDIARQLYDPDGTGQVIDAQTEGFAEAFARTASLLTQPQPVFEAGFSVNGALAFADVMVPIVQSGSLTWRMVEVKSSTSVKDYYREDIAIQTYVARSTGVALSSVALAHINSSWVYPGGGNYQGLLHENDLTTESFARESDVKSWIADAQAVASQSVEPKIHTGRHCHEPFECGFLAYCESQEPQAEYPIAWLPHVKSLALNAFIDSNNIRDLREVPDELLNQRQVRVKTHTLSGDVYFDAEGAAADLSGCQLPAYFLDFETTQFAVPIWAGTRPYQQIPFQFSLHILDRSEKFIHDAFLDLSGKDPSRLFSEALISACGDEGPVFVYNAGFETARIKELAARFSELSSRLLAINNRVVDLLPIARERYYHPSQHGSWSIKKVLPAVAPDLRYDALDGVQNGGMAMDAYREAVSTNTTDVRKREIELQLLEYCGLDTWAMVRLWQFFTGRDASMVGQV